MTAPLALDGIKVADFSQGIAGPHAGLLLAQQGADVIKIEPPGAGDWARALGRSYGDASAHSIFYNRGKRSLAIDLKAKAGRDLAFQIASKADIVIEAFRPGIMKRFGLDYETLRQGNAGLIYLAVTGFGQSGVNAHMPATDAVIQGYSGLMVLNKDSSGTPQRVPMIAIDVTTGLFAANAITSALVRRLRFGEGAFIDCSLLQSAIAFQASRIIESYFQGDKPESMYVPVGVLPTKDSFLSISVSRDNHFVELCKAMGRAELAFDPRYCDRAARVAHEDELMPIIRAVFKTRTTREWIDVLTAAGVLHAQIRSYEDVLGDAEIKRLGYLEWLEQDGISVEVPIPNIAGARRASDGGRLTQSPRLGQHSREVLAEYGVPQAEIDALISQNVVKQFVA
jgi:crotonobetainyl-CoA:carnitine CoA-transferase CaiB-like acyl-CoA transferase